MQKYCTLGSNLLGDEETGKWECFEVSFNDGKWQQRVMKRVIDGFIESILHRMRFHADWMNALIKNQYSSSPLSP